MYYNQVRGQHGSRYADLTQDPAFAFGQGLSYTSIEYTDLVVTTPVVTPEETIRARVTLTNTGTRPALETVQVYLRDVVTSASWADRELKTFTQVDVAPGASVDVDLVLEARDCTIVDGRGRRVVEPGEFQLLVGPSSRLDDLLSSTFHILTDTPS